MSRKNLFIVTLTLLFFQQSFSQNRFEEYNLLGVNVGYTLFDINTSNFQTEQGGGFMAGFTTRGTFYEALDLIYGINYIGSKVGILANGINTSTGSVGDEYVDYNISGAQLTLLASVNIFRHNFTIEAGPILNVNGKMKLKNDSYSEYIIDGFTTLKAKDIQNISKINFHVLGGFSAGVRNFRLSGHYQYGVTNMFAALNDQDIEKDSSKFKGNSSTIIISATIYL